MRTIIYCGQEDGIFHQSVNEEVNDWRFSAEAGIWFFPEITYNRSSEPVARHPARIIELVPEMVGRTIVTMSEHIILAFQQLVRQRKIEWADLELYCGNTRVYHGDDGDLEYWPRGFFRERLGLLR